MVDRACDSMWNTLHSIPRTTQQGSMVQPKATIVSCTLLGQLQKKSTHVFTANNVWALLIPVSEVWYKKHGRMKEKEAICSFLPRSSPDLGAYHQRSSSIWDRQLTKEGSSPLSPCWSGQQLSTPAHTERFLLPHKSEKWHKPTVFSTDVAGDSDGAEAYLGAFY